MSGDEELSRLQRWVVGAAGTVAALVVLVHSGFTFFHIASTHAAKEQHDVKVTDDTYPEFSQGWRLFALTPTQADTGRKATGE